jgi:LysM repeat protein
MKLSKIIFSSFIFLSLYSSVFSQDDNRGDDGEEIKMSQQEWHLKRDQYAVSAIKLLERLEKLDSLIDSLKQVNRQTDSILANSENILYSMVDATREQVADFRRKFDEAENMLAGKTRSPSEIENFFYYEIFSSKIRCLPEFQERFAEMNEHVKDITMTPKKEEVVVSDNSDSYVVSKGDCLWKIAELKYGSRKFWTVIWEANKKEVSSEIEPDISEPDPNFIYPGQVLRIPRLSEQEKEKFKEKRKK